MFVECCQLKNVSQNTFYLLLHNNQYALVMSKSVFNFFSIAVIFLFLLSCSNSCKVNHSNKSGDQNELTGKNEMAGPPVIVYKTKTDHYDKVPVTLSDDKSEVVSYPGIKDIYYKGELAYPTKLNDGYLLDNRGIGPNSAFLKLTYEDYSKLDSTPSKDELLGLILDKDPFDKMYNCGSKYKFKDIVSELNTMIDDKKIKKQTRLK